MKSYSSFLVKCWVIREEGSAERMVFDLEHIQTGEHWRALSPETAFAQLMQICQQPASAGALETINESEPSSSQTDG